MIALIQKEKKIEVNFDFFNSENNIFSIGKRASPVPYIKMVVILI